MDTNVFVGKKLGLKSLRQPRSTPWAALETIVVFVTNCPWAGTPKIRIAASFCLPSGGTLQASLPEELVPPAYSMRAKSILLVALGSRPYQIPSQSPGAGASSADVKIIGFAAVPAATSDPSAGVVPTAAVTVIIPPFLNRRTTPGSIVSTTGVLTLGSTSTRRIPKLVGCPTR